MDLNRNYGYQWGGGGSSGEACLDTYRGASADSEPETQAVENAILALRGNWDAFVSFHSFGQYL